MYTSYIPDKNVPVKRLQLNAVVGGLVEAPPKDLFVRGPIPMEWLSMAAAMPGKTLNVAVALWWLHGMQEGKPFKLTKKAAALLNIGRDAASGGLAQLAQGGLITLHKRSGKRPEITIIKSLRRPA